jgi:hypothetical protein
LKNGKNGAKIPENYPKTISGFPNNINDFSMFGGFSGGVSSVSHAGDTGSIPVGITKQTQGVRHFSQPLFHLRVPFCVPFIHGMTFIISIYCIEDC